MIRILPGLAVALMFPLFYLFLQITVAIEIPSSRASYFSRTLSIFSMGLLFFYSLHNGRLQAKWSLHHLSILLFMMLYTFRIFQLNDELTWNLDVELYPFFRVSILFIFGSIAPFLLALFSAKLFILPSTAFTFTASTFLSIAVVALMNLDQFGVFRTSGVDSGSIASLSMGYLAALGVSYCLLDFVRIKRFSWFILIFVLICSIFLLSVSASRGPILAALLSSVYILATMRKTALNLTLGVVIAVTIVAGSIWYFNYSGSGILQRIDGTDVEETRIDLYTESLKIIEANILFGKDIALPNGLWPHNLVLEALMAVGIFGFLLIIPWIAALVKIISDSKDNNKQWLYVWFLQTTVMNMFTDTIWSGSSLFICLCIILGGGEKTTRKNIKRRRRKKRKVSLQATIKRYHPTQPTKPKKSGRSRNKKEFISF